MGAAESQGLPSRVQLVFGGHCALAKLGRADCKVSAVGVQDLAMQSRKTWWKVCHAGPTEHEPAGLRGQYFIRHDHHPNRSLRTGAPVRADDCKWTDAHRWVLEPASEADGCGGSGPLAFHIKNVKDGSYLAVIAECADGFSVVMQLEKPKQPWEFFDATQSPWSSSTTLAQGPCCPGSCVPALCEVEETSVFEIAPPVLSLPFSRYPTGPGDLEAHDGCLTQAFQYHRRTSSGSRDFTSPTIVMEQGTTLGQEVEIAFGDVTPAGVCVALFGPQSNFLKQLAADGEDVSISPFRLVPNTSWCCNAVSSFKISVPVLGQRPLEEEFRIALCHEGGSPALAVQMSTCISIGFPVGNLVTDALHIFIKGPEGQGAPVRLRSYGWAAPGNTQKKALEGLQQSRERFVYLVKQAIEEASSSDLLRAASVVGRSFTDKLQQALSPLSRSFSPRIHTSPSEATKASSDAFAGNLGNKIARRVGCASGLCAGCGLGVQRLVRGWKRCDSTKTRNCVSF